MGDSAFANCQALTQIRFAGEAPEFGDNCFQNVNATVSYPAEEESWSDDTVKGLGGNLSLEAVAPEVPEIPEAPTVPEGLPGDASGDGKVNYQDAMMVLRSSIGLETLSEEAKALCDVDGKPGINYQDAMLILRASIGLEELQ